MLYLTEHLTLLITYALECNRVLASVLFSMSSCQAQKQLYYLPGYHLSCSGHEEIIF
ncbi:hypothetical protein K435DRAFT_786191 [Dendrothele bispora CBS 962.96]|uniref:Uncharacterized protein n=1 Tax=Dendrothele bispora (strain CBS 962.96) TaxID=1314807 RepID=A0A4S8KS30_DENBC|nr:hypothetical protein K435DRAFT_786191 [Dendrothele bispora CBS 962.96]